MKWWHRPQRFELFDFGDRDAAVSEYIDAYIAHQARPPGALKPPATTHETNAPLSDKTTFREDYVTHALTKRPARPKEEYVSPDAAMDVATMYQLHYPERREVVPAKAKKPRGRRTFPVAKFVAQPTYASDFRRWGIPPRAKTIQTEMYEKPDVKMATETTFQKDYVGQRATPRESSRPPNVAYQSSAPLDGATIHATSFVPHPLERRSKRKKEVYVPPTVPMDGATTFRTHFTKHDAMPAKSMRPDQTAFNSSDPLSSSSEFRDSYVAWPVKRPHLAEPVDYVKPEGRMELETTQRSHFRVINARPAEARRPIPRRQRTTPFDGTTNYRQDFKKWKIERILFRPRKASIFSGGEFDGLSTARSHYVAYQSAKPSRPFKPENVAFCSSSMLDDRTIYNESYTRPSSRLGVERYPTPRWKADQEKTARGRNSAPHPSEEH